MRDDAITLYSALAIFSASYISHYKYQTPFLPPGIVTSQAYFYPEDWGIQTCNQHVGLLLVVHCVSPSRTFHFVQTI